MKTEPLSVSVGRVRDQLVESRRTLNNLALQGAFKDRLENVSGLLTCGISTLYEYRRSIAKFEVEIDDAARGKHLRFSPRGIGKDICPGCFVCGAEKRSPEAVNDYLHNIAGYVNSKEDAEVIIGWFNGKARLDSRRDHRQLKFGACDKHIPNLRLIGDVTNAYGVIRKLDVDDAVAFVEPEVVAEPKPELDSELEELASYLAAQFPATVGHIPLKEKLAALNSRLRVT